jgi:Flp pilus assembly protein CpaB
MKRNLVPLLGIAFVVAIAATGVFSGLFVGNAKGASPAAAPAEMVVASRALARGMVVTAADVRMAPVPKDRPAGAVVRVEDVVGRSLLKPVGENEAVTADGLAGAAGQGGALTIPTGMRAMSIRVADSVGLVPYLRAGARIDVQSIHVQHGEATVQTLLSNVEVLNVHVDSAPQPSPATVLNLLVPAGEVEKVALADSAAKVRIVLRNAEDGDEAPVAPAGRVRAVAAGAANAGPSVSPQVAFEVRMAAAPAATVRAMAGKAAAAPGGDGAVRIGLLPADWAVAELEKEKDLRVLSTERVQSAHWYEVSLKAGTEVAKEYDLRLGLTPRGGANGTVRVRVRPELTLPQRGGMSSRKFSADLLMAEGQSVLVAGFERDAAAPALAGKLFGAAAPAAESELLLLVTRRALAAR